MSKVKQKRIPVTLEDLSNAIPPSPPPNWKLVRERDGLIKKSAEVMWLEFDDMGWFKAKHNEPAVGRSLIMSPFNHFFTWQTTTITRIVEQTEDYIKFDTENSTYELFKLQHNDTEN